MTYPTCRITSPLLSPNGASLASASNQTSFFPLVDQRLEGHQQSAVSVDHKLLPSPQTALPPSEKFPARTNMDELLTGSFRFHRFSLHLGSQTRRPHPSFSFVPCGPASQRVDVPGCRAAAEIMDIKQTKLIVLDLDFSSHTPFRPW